jgi:hypothetical protein
MTLMTLVLLGLKQSSLSRQVLGPSAGASKLLVLLVEVPTVCCLQVFSHLLQQQAAALIPEDPSAAPDPPPHLWNCHSPAVGCLDAGLPGSEAGMQLVEVWHMTQVAPAPAAVPVTTPRILLLLLLLLCHPLWGLCGRPGSPCRTGVGLAPCRASAQCQSLLVSCLCQLLPAFIASIVAIMCSPFITTHPGIENLLLKMCVCALLNT